MSLGMNSYALQHALKEAGSRLSGAICSKPFVSRAMGRHLLRRLASGDWIKSPLLTSFLRPMTLPHLCRPSGDDIRHAVLRLDELGPGATTLDALEQALEDFDRRSVGALRQWFKELRGLTGYWFDKRMQTLEFEMCAAAATMEWADVTILDRDPPRKTPDFLARTGGLIIVADAKLLLGKYWPIKIVRTMVHALEENFGLTAARGVIVVPSGRQIKPESLEEEVANLSVGTLVGAVEAVAGGSPSFPLTCSLVMERATERDRAYSQRAFAGHLPDDKQWRPFFDSLSTKAETIRRACQEAWDQCGAYGVGEWALGQRLDVAFVAGEYFLLHEDLGPTQALLRAWLQSEVWPAHPRRAVVMASTEMLKPVWFLNPALRPAQPQDPAATA